MEAQGVVNRRAHVVGHIDGAFVQGREDLAAGQQGGFGAGRGEQLGYHSARDPHLSATEIFNGADGHLGVDDIGTVMDRAHIVHSLFCKQFTGDFQAAEAVIENVPFVGIAHAHGVGA